MSLRFGLLTAFAAFHLVLVACGAAHIRLFSPRTPVGHTVDAYAALSGADNTFGFFAPGVAPRFTVQFTLTDDAGRSWDEQAEQGVTREANLRFDSMASMFTFKGLRGKVGASWAAALFGRYPHVRQVEILAEAEVMPTMEAYRDGLRPESETVYNATFTREGDAE
jgi:hypothetical protein